MAAPPRTTENASLELLSPLFVRTRDFMFSSLREEHPYMKIDAIHDIVTTTIRTFEEKIKYHQPAEDETKKRSSFMSLPPDLRLLIYDLALRPENDGDGGIAECRAIFLGVNAPHGPRGSMTVPDYRITTWTQQPPITMLNRHIRSETLPVYYGCNNFVLDASYRTLFRPEGGRVGPKQWLHRIGPQNRCLIKHLDVIFDMPVEDPKCRSRQDGERMLLERDIPLLESARYFGTYGARDSFERIWWPLDLPMPTKDELSSLTVTEKSLAYSSVDRRRIPARDMHMFEDEDT